MVSDAKGIGEQDVLKDSSRRSRMIMKRKKPFVNNYITITAASIVIIH